MTKAKPSDVIRAFMASGARWTFIAVRQTAFLARSLYRAAKSMRAPVGFTQERGRGLYLYRKDRKGR